MIRKLVTLGLGLSMLARAEVAIERPAQVSHTERVDFAPGGTVRLNDSFGDLYIEGWNLPAVEMTLVKEMLDYNAPKNVSARLEGVRFTTEHPSANELVIGTTIPSRSFFRHPFGGRGDVNVRYELRVPRDSRLVIRHGGGNVLIDNVTGGVEANNRDGDIVLLLPAPGPYAIDARSKMGTVISDFAGKAHVKYFIGEKFTGTNESAAHPIHLRVGFGGITIKEMPAEAAP
jgi:hypothetical protein